MQNMLESKEKDVKHQSQLVSYQKECQKQLDIMKEGCTKQVSCVQQLFVYLLLRQ